MNTMNNKDQGFSNSVPQHRKHILADMAPMLKNIPLIEAQGGKIPKILLEHQNEPTEKTQIPRQKM